MDFVFLDTLTEILCSDAQANIHIVKLRTCVYARCRLHHSPISQNVLVFSTQKNTNPVISVAIFPYLWKCYFPASHIESTSVPSPFSFLLNRDYFLRVVETVSFAIKLLRLHLWADKCAQYKKKLRTHIARMLYITCASYLYVIAYSVCYNITIHLFHALSTHKCIPHSSNIE